MAVTVMKKERKREERQKKKRDKAGSFLGRLCMHKSVVFLNDELLHKLYLDFPLTLG